MNRRYYSLVYRHKFLDYPTYCDEDKEVSAWLLTYANLENTSGNPMLSNEIFLIDDEFATGFNLKFKFWKLVSL